MPELPEVETVRRGLQPVMEGARFTKVEAHRGDLRVLAVCVVHLVVTGHDDACQVVGVDAAFTNELVHSVHERA